MDLEAEIDRLYGLTPAEFTAARDELAKRARDELGPDEAKQVKALKKPVTAIWAVNQLWHRDAKRFRRLLETGDRVRAVQATRGRAPASLGEALEAQRDLVRELLADAARILAEAGFAVDTNLERVRANLAAMSAWGADLPQQPGRLDADVEPPGFEALLRVAPAGPRLRVVQPEPEPARPARRGAGLRARPEPTPRPRARPQPPKPKGPTKTEREAQAAAKREVARRQRELDRAADRARSARERLAEAQSATKRAQEALARAQAAEDRLRDALSEAEAERKRAATALADAERALGR